MPSVFVSHSSKDRGFVENELIPLLQRYQITPWYSKDDIPSAAVWEQTIRDGLKSCEWFLVVLSPDAVRSNWVQAEVHWAIEHRSGKMVPVIARGCDPADLNLQLIRYQYIDFSQDRDLFRAKLLAVWSIVEDDSPKLQLRVRIDARKVKEEKITKAFKRYAGDTIGVFRRSAISEGEQLFEIDGFATVGLAADSSFRLFSPFVSQIHAAFRVKNIADKNELWVFNLGTNGTLVNGIDVNEKKIQPGDVIGIGGIEITILEILG